MFNETKHVIGCYGSNCGNRNPNDDGRRVDRSSLCFYCWRGLEEGAKRPTHKELFAFESNKQQAKKSTHHRSVHTTNRATNGMRDFVFVQCPRENEIHCLLFVIYFYSLSYNINYVRHMFFSLPVISNLNLYYTYQYLCQISD